MVFHLISWGLPLTFCIVLGSADGYARNERGGWCHPTGTWQIVLWEVPMIAAFLLNAILSCVITIFIRHRLSKAGKGLFGPLSSSMFSKPFADYTAGTRRHLSSRVTRQLALFLIVYLVCWLPDVISHISIFIWPSCHLFWYTQDLSSLSLALTFLMSCQAECFTKHICSVTR